MLFNTITIIGFGMIGSSLARKIRKENISEKIIGADISEDVCERVRGLNLADEVTTDLKASVVDADLVIICAPIGAYDEIGKIISSNLKSGAIVTDVGSVKMAAIKALAPNIPAHATFIPAHPIAGIEKSGPEVGFSSLFEGRWAILTPTDEQEDSNELNKVSEFWSKLGSMVDVMTPDHHDKVLGITSHLPHLIAFTIVGTASNLEDDLKSEIIKYSAGGFRDFTRIAAGDPTMWRDVFLNNKEAVLDVLQRFTEDLSELQKSIRRGESDKLFDYFTKTSEIRRGVIDAKQDIPPEKK